MTPGVVKYHPTCLSTCAQLPHLYFYQNPSIEFFADYTISIIEWSNTHRGVCVWGGGGANVPRVSYAARGTKRSLLK